MDSIVAFIEQSGAWVYVLAPLFMIVVAILPIPAEIPAVLNGMIFGPLIGTGITWGGAVVGAVVSFELARRHGRPLAVRLLSGDAVGKLDRVASSTGWPGLLTLRLLPIVAFHLINWGAGFTAVSRWTFFWTTAVGILPGAILFTISGSGLRVLYARNPLLSVVVGLLLLPVIVWTARRYRDRALAGESRPEGRARPSTPP